MSSSLLTDLGALEAKLAEARERLRDRERELDHRRRELAAAREQRLALERRRGAGEPVDQDEEERLDGLLNAPGVELEGDVRVDRHVRERIAGAASAVEAAENELRSFARRHFDELQEELLEGWDAEKAELLDRARELAAAIDAAQPRWRRLGRVEVLATGHGLDRPRVLDDELRRELRRVGA